MIVTPRWIASPVVLLLTLFSCWAACRAQTNFTPPPRSQHQYPSSSLLVTWTPWIGVYQNTPIQGSSNTGQWITVRIASGVSPRVTVVYQGNMKKCQVSVTASAQVADGCNAVNPSYCSIIYFGNGTYLTGHYAPTIYNTINDALYLSVEIQEVGVMPDSAAPYCASSYFLPVGSSIMLTRSSSPSGIVLDGVNLAPVSYLSVPGATGDITDFIYASSLSDIPQSFMTPTTTQLAPTTTQLAPTSTQLMALSTTQLAPTTTQLAPTSTQLMAPSTTQLAPTTTQLAPTSTQLMAPSTTQLAPTTTDAIATSVTPSTTYTNSYSASTSNHGPMSTTSAATAPVSTTSSGPSTATCCPCPGITTSAPVSTTSLANTQVSTTSAPVQVSTTSAPVSTTSLANIQVSTTSAPVSTTSLANTQVSTTSAPVSTTSLANTQVSTTAAPVSTTSLANTQVSTTSAPVSTTSLANTQVSTTSAPLTTSSGGTAACCPCPGAGTTATAGQVTSSTTTAPAVVISTTQSQTSGVPSTSTLAASPTTTAASSVTTASVNTACNFCVNFGYIWCAENSICMQSFQSPYFSSCSSWTVSTAGCQAIQSPPNTNSPSSAPATGNFFSTASFVSTTSQAQYYSRSVTQDRRVLSDTSSTPSLPGQDPTSSVGGGGNTILPVENSDTGSGWLPTDYVITSVAAIGSLGFVALMWKSGYFGRRRVELTSNQAIAGDHPTIVLNGAQVPPGTM